jgi:uncharacterized SAM-dependent methyltransferase
VGELAGLIREESLLIELGSGASKKVRLLLEQLRPSAYVGVDISKEFLLNATATLARDYPWLRGASRLCGLQRRPRYPARR